VFPQPVRAQALQLAAEQEAALPEHSDAARPDASAVGAGE